MSSVEANVRARYSAGARARQEDLCCPVDYDRSLLRLLPEEIIERDYGCGDPSRYVREGDVVLDLGSGGGKICYMAAQLVGSQGRVIGVDMNDDMLTLARKHQAHMAQTLGNDRVQFLKGYIQDLALDVAALEQYLLEQPVSSVETLDALEAWKVAQRRQRPLIADASVDLVISNCVLNLVSEADRRQMLSEIFRVLRPGGRVAISDIVSDAPVPESLRLDADLWTGCISGAFHEADFLQAFADAGFAAPAYDQWQETPWRVVEGIEFRSVTLTALKPPGVPRHDVGQAALYLGPWKEVRDDFGNVFPRGRRMAVSERTFELIRNSLMAKEFVLVEPAKRCAPRSMCEALGSERPAAQTRGTTSTGSAGKGCC